MLSLFARGVIYLRYPFLTKAVIGRWYVRGILEVWHYHSKE